MKILESLLSPFKSRKVVEPEPYTTHPNGLVSVNREALESEDGRPLSALSIAAFQRPRDMDYLMTALSKRELYDTFVFMQLWLDVNNSLGYQDVCRALSVGSCLFNYQIPQSFVLIDRYTRLMFAQYVALSAFRMTLLEWVNDPDIASGRNPVIPVSNAYELGLEATINGAISFYNRFQPFLLEQLWDASNFPSMPDVDAFTTSMAQRLSLPAHDIVSMHYLRVCLSVILINTSIKVPATWIMYSNLVKELQSLVTKEEDPIRPKLALVVNNSVSKDRL